MNADIEAKIAKKSKNVCHGDYIKIVLSLAYSHQKEYTLCILPEFIQMLYILQLKDAKKLM